MKLYSEPNNTLDGILNFHITQYMLRYKVGKITARKILTSVLESNCIIEEMDGQAGFVVSGEPVYNTED